MATDGVHVNMGNGLRLMYQTPDGDELPEPAIALRAYDQEPAVFGIIQGDQEITVGGTKSLRLLGKALIQLAKDRESAR